MLRPLRAPRSVDDVWTDVLARLPAEEREVLILRLIHGIPANALADRFGLAEAEVREIQLHALRASAEYYRQSWAVRAVFGFLGLAAAFAGSVWLAYGLTPYGGNGMIVMSGGILVASVVFLQRAFVPRLGQYLALRGRA
ncbi:MAG: sigma factor-like helix-turn-helix DNA-binding protein [Dehalococcoidia bacterium]